LGPAISKLFGKPLLLDGEDLNGYEELFAQLLAAVEPENVIDQILTRDAADLQWEVSRWRRVKFAVIRRCTLKAVEDFLGRNLDDDLFRTELVEELTGALQANVEEAEKRAVAQLARQCGRYEPDAVEKVKRLLDGMDLDFDQFRDDVRSHKAEELMQKYAQRQPETVTLVDEFLTREGTDVDSLLAGELQDELEYIERIDRLTTIAENRRNASLREIERRRSATGEALRRRVQQIDHSEIRAIEDAQSKRRNVA
jgi:hypothetical protein